MGEVQELTIVRDSQQGLYVGDADGEVLLPRRLCPQDVRIGRQIKVFIHTDSDDRPIATTKTPIAQIGQFAMLRVVAVTPAGAFLDWGLDKDLFCPMGEQATPMREDERVLVRIYLDEASGRVVCTSKYARFLRTDGEDLRVGQPVKIMIAAHQPNHTTVIIDGHIRGSLFADEWHEKLVIGEVLDGYVKQIRTEDRKVAVSLRPQGYQAVLGERDRVLSALRASGGFLPVSDKTSPEEIHRRFGLSKGSFKKLIGTLYREQVIEIEYHGIRLK
jgi:predicted RNA-binding protein (virulence factor B family)